MVGFVLFIIGLVLSVIGGLFLPENAIVVMVLAIIGIVIGIIMLKARDIRTLLLATIALLAMTAAFAPVTVLGVGKLVSNILVDFAAMMAPIALITAIKALLTIGLAKPAKKV